MKILKSLLLTLLLSNIFASGIGGVVGGSNDGRISPANNWNEIRSAVKSNPKYKISGDYAYVGQIVSIFDVCTDGKNFITKEELPVRRIVKVPRSRDNDGDRDGYASRVVDYKKRVYPLNAIQKLRECDHNDKNCKYVDKEFNQDTIKAVTVEKFLREEGSEKRKVYRKLFKKDYFVPNCK